MQQNLKKKKHLENWGFFHTEMTLGMKRSGTKLVVSKLVGKDSLSDEIYFSFLGSQELMYFSFVR